MTTGSPSPHPEPLLSFEEQLVKGLGCRLVLILTHQDALPDIRPMIERLHAWAAEQEQSGGLVLWVYLEAADDQPDRLLERLFEALAHSNGSETTNSPRSPGEDLEDRLHSFINRLAEQDRELVLVLENYAVIVSAESHALISRLLDYLPPQGHVYLVSPCEPPLPIPRLRARRQLVEIHAS